MNPHTENLPAPPRGNLETPQPHTEVFDVPPTRARSPRALDHLDPPQPPAPIPGQSSLWSTPGRALPKDQL